MIGAISWARESLSSHASEFTQTLWLTSQRYQRAWIDFFEDQLVAFGYDWKALLNHFLYDGDEPLINCAIGGCGSQCPQLSTGANGNVQWLTHSSTLVTATN